MEQVIAAAIHRRQIALFLIIKVLQQRQDHCRRHLWSRQWLQRRDNYGVLTMLFAERG